MTSQHQWCHNDLDYWFYFILFYFKPKTSFGLRKRRFIDLEKLHYNIIDEWPHNDVIMQLIKVIKSFFT